VRYNRSMLDDVIEAWETNQRIRDWHRR